MNDVFKASIFLVQEYPTKQKYLKEQAFVVEKILVPFSMCITCIDVFCIYVLTCQCFVCVPGVDSCFFCFCHSPWPWKHFMHLYKMNLSTSKLVVSAYANHLLGLSCGRYCHFMNKVSFVFFSPSSPVQSFCFQDDMYLFIYMYLNNYMHLLFFLFVVLLIK